MAKKLGTGLALFLLAVGLTLTCESNDEESAPGEPNELHPNSTSPDEQGESGSLIEPPDDKRP